MFLKYTGREHFRILNPGDVPTTPEEDAWQGDDLVWEQELGHVAQVEDDHLGAAILERVQGFSEANEEELQGHVFALDRRQKALEAEQRRLNDSIDDRGTLPIQPEESADASDDAIEVDDQADDLDD